MTTCQKDNVFIRRRRTRCLRDQQTKVVARKLSLIVVHSVGEVCCHVRKLQRWPKRLIEVGTIRVSIIEASRNQLAVYKIERRWHLLLVWELLCLLGAVCFGVVVYLLLATSCRRAAKLLAVGCLLRRTIWTGLGRLQELLLSLAS